MTTAVTLILGRRRCGEIHGLPERTESWRRLPVFTQWAADRTLVGAISEPVQIRRRFCSSATANCQPAAFALPPPTIRCAGCAPARGTGEAATPIAQSTRAAAPMRRPGLRLTGG